jgi:hypothetical protein
MDARAPETVRLDAKATYENVIELSEFALALVGGGVGEIVVG